MADEGPPRRPAGPEPASDAKKHANKLVVLSSVATGPPADAAESLLGEAGTSGQKPPPLPAKTAGEGLIHPVGWTTRPGGTTTIIKLPPKTGVLPRLTSLSQKGREQPPPLPPPEAPVSNGEEAKRLPPIKLHHPPSLSTATESESIFSSASAVPPPPADVLPPSLLKPLEKKSGAPAPPDSSLISRSTFLAQPVMPARPETDHPLIQHAPPLVPHESSAPVSEEKGTKPVFQPQPPTELRPIATTKAPETRPGDQPTQRLLPMPGLPGTGDPVTPVSPVPASAPASSEAKPPENEVRKMRLPPRATTSARLKPMPEAPPTVIPKFEPTNTIQKPAAIATPPKVFPVTPPTIPLNPAANSATVLPPSSAIRPVKATVTPPTIPLRPVASGVPPPAVPAAAPVAAATVPLLYSASTPKTGKPQLPEEELAEPAPSAAGLLGKGAVLPSTRSERMRKRRLIGIIAFYVLFVALIPCLYFAALYFSRETRMEGQVIPPVGMVLGNEVWVVTDFRDLASGIASDLASDRSIVMQDMQEKLGHVQRSQADVASREARIRTLNDQIKADNQEQLSLVKQARDASQEIWDGPGAALESEYQSKLGSLNQAIAARAQANHLEYAPDPNYFSPEVWANAYRLALYQVPAGVDTVKERLWLDQQMKNWRDFTKSMDVRQNQLREQATQLKLAPAARVAEIKTQMDELQQRIDGTQAEEEPLKAELEQAQTDLAAVQAKEAGLDAKPLAKLDALPEQNITKRLPLNPNGRFSWREVEKESKYAEDEKSHVYWVFARAYRSDGMQFWSLHRVTVEKDRTAQVTFEPRSFISTRSILRPDLPPDDQTR